MAPLTPPKLDERRLTNQHKIYIKRSYVSEYTMLKKCVFYGTLEHGYFGDVSDGDRQSILFSWCCHRESSLSKFCSGARYVEFAGVRRSEPTAARNRQNSSSCVCNVGWTRQRTSQDRACNESDKRPVTNVATASYR